MSLPVPRPLRTASRLMLVSAAITAVVAVAGLFVFWEGARTLGGMVWVALPGVLQLVLARRVPVGGRGLFWAIVVLHAFLVLSALANLTAGMPQGFGQLVIPVLVLVCVTRPRARAYLDSPRSSRARPGGRGLLRRIRDPERGAGFTEYAAVITLVAAVAAAVLFTDIGSQVRASLEDSVNSIFNGGGSASGGPGGDGGEDGAGGTPLPVSLSSDEGDGGGAWGGPPDGEDTGSEGGSGDDGGSTGGSGEQGDGGGVEGEGDNGGGNGVLDHVGGFFGGLFGGAYDDITGIGDLFTTNPLDTLSGMWNGIVEDPWGLVISPEARDAWSSGDYGEFLGRGLWDVGSWFIPGPGWLAKGGKLFRLDTPDADAPNTPDANTPDSDAPDNGNNGGGNNGVADDLPTCRLNSFLPGTRVLMADGSRTAIEDIGVGDLVHAFDPVTGEEGPREVTALLSSSGPKTLVTVTVADGTGTATVTATAEHPFWLPAEATWTDAADLAAGDRLRTAAGDWARVTAVAVTTAPDQRVHNLAVADLHTYHVTAGTADVLVHNQNPGSCIPDDSHLPPAQQLIDSGEKYDKNSPYWRGRNLPASGGPPNGTLYKQNPQTGEITNYIVYDANGNAIKRVDLTGDAHAGVPTPHAIPYQHNTDPQGNIRVQGLRNDVRPARPDEIP